jgi:hydrogenase maturation protease
VTEVPDIRVIGVGNEFRRDDGVGLRVVDEVRRRDPSVTVLARDGEPTRLLDAWEGADAVVVVDALRSGAAPGTIWTLRVEDGIRLPSAAGPGSHGAGGADAVELGRALRRLPRVVLCGVEAADFGEGPTLSPAVAAAVDEAARRVLAEVRRLRNGTKTGS